MLIIINGVETIHRKWFSEEVYKAMNTFTVDDYSVKFVGNTYKITSLISTSTDATIVTMNEGDTTISYETVSIEAGEVVFDVATNNNRILSFNNGATTLKKVEELFSSFVFHQNHFANVFVDLNYEFEYTQSFEGEQHVQGSYCYPIGYENLIANYNESIAETHVISGAFSRSILDQIKTDIGAENVKIVNIIRNPCACFIAHPKPDSHYEANPNYSRQFHDERLPKSLITAANLIKFEDVETLRFEDIVEAGSFTINGVTIPFPMNHASMYNAWITTYEKNLVDETLATLPQSVVDQFVTSYADQVYLYQHFGTTKNSPWMPENIFEMLGYTPVDYNTITQPDAS